MNHTTLLDGTENITDPIRTIINKILALNLPMSNPEETLLKMFNRINNENFIKHSLTQNSPLAHYDDYLLGVSNRIEFILEEAIHHNHQFLQVFCYFLLDNENPFDYLGIAIIEDMPTGDENDDWHYWKFHCGCAVWERKLKFYDLSPLLHIYKFRSFSLNNIQVCDHCTNKINELQVVVKCAQ